MVTVRYAPGTTASNGTIWVPFDTTLTVTGVTSSSSTSWVAYGWVETAASNQVAYTGFEADRRFQARYRSNGPPRVLPRSMGPLPVTEIEDATPEQAARVAELAANAVERAAAMRARDRRALTLLRDVLTDAEWDELVEKDSVILQGAAGGWYELNLSTVAALDEKGEHVTHSLCIHADRSFHHADSMVAVILDLRADERDVRARANRTPMSTVGMNRRLREGRGYMRALVAQAA